MANRVRDGFSIAIPLAAWIPLWWIIPGFVTLFFIVPVYAGPVIFYRCFRTMTGLVLAGLLGTSWVAIVTIRVVLRVHGFTSAAATVMRTVDALLLASTVLGVALLAAGSTEMLVMRGRRNVDDARSPAPERTFPRRWWAYLAVALWGLQVLLLGGPLLLMGYYEI